MKSSTRILLTVIILIAGIGIVVSTVAVPSLIDISKLAEQIDRERQRIEPIVERALRFRSTKEDVQLVQKDLSHLLKLFLNEGDEILLFTALEQKSKAAGLIQTLRVGESRSAGGVKMLPINLTLEGRYANVVQYIVDLEQMPLILNIKNISIQKNPTPTSSDRSIVVHLQAEIFTALPNPSS